MSNKKFVLVRWIDEESVGVMPISAAVNKQDVYVGSRTKMKWGGKKQYDVQILKVSEDKGQLTRDCEKLENFELSVDDFIRRDGKEVSSSNAVLPCRNIPVYKTKKRKGSESKTDREKEILFAFKKSKILFPDDDDMQEDTFSDKEFPYVFDDEVDLTPPERLEADKITALEEEIRCLKNQLKMSRPSLVTTVTKNVVSNSTFDALSKTIQHDKYQDVSPPASSNCKDKYQTPASSSCKITEIQENKDVKTLSKVELVQGFITKRHLDDCLDTSRNSPTRLIRNLIAVFFQREFICI